MNLTNRMLRKIIEEEISKFRAERDVEAVAKETEEVDADELADTPEKKIDFMKALKIEEARLVRRLRRIQEQKKRVRHDLAKKA